MALCLRDDIVDNPTRSISKATDNGSDRQRREAIALRRRVVCGEWIRGFARGTMRLEFSSGD